MDISKLQEAAAAKQAQKFLARKIYPIYKTALRQTIDADAGAELREILYFIKSARPGCLYRGTGWAGRMATYNHWSDYYEQGKQFYVGSTKGRRGIKVRILHPPKQDINYVKDLSTARYSPKAFKDQRVD